MPVQTYELIAMVKEDAQNGYAKVEMRNRFKIGDKLEVLSADNNFLKTIEIKEIFDSKGQPNTDAKRVQEIVTINCPYNLKAGDILRVENIK